MDASQNDSLSGDELADRIIRMIWGGSKPEHDILQSLKLVLVFHMSLVCHNCQRDLVRRLKRDLPIMLIDARRLRKDVLASMPDTPTTCH
jgi:hypothetical protein